MSDSGDLALTDAKAMNAAVAAIRLDASTPHHAAELVQTPVAEIYRLLPETMSAQERNLRAFLYVQGMVDNQTNLEQLQVMTAALRKFGERNQRYKDVWKESGWKGSLFDMRKKLTRIWRVFWRGEPTEQIDWECDDAYDLINFTAFFIRNVRDNNQWGQWG